MQLLINLYQMLNKQKENKFVYNLKLLANYTAGSVIFVSFLPFKLSC